MDFNLAPCLKHDHYPPRRMSSCTHLPEETGSDCELTETRSSCCVGFSQMFCGDAHVTLCCSDV